MNKIKLYDRYNNYKGSTLVSPSDYTHLNQFNWNINTRGYINGHINGKTVLMHRYICQVRKKCDIEGKIIDHINNNPLDNTRGNLRCTNHYGNNINRSKAKNMTSKFIGVYYNKEKQKWKSAITVNGEKIFIGYYDKEIDAAKARDKVAAKSFKNKGQMNFKKK